MSRSTIHSCRRLSSSSWASKSSSSVSPARYCSSSICSRVLCRRASSSLTYPPELILTSRDRLRGTPEQLRAAELAQLAQGIANVVQQAVLLALSRQSLQLRIECAQLSYQGVDRLLLRAELRDERVLSLQRLVVRLRLLLRRGQVVHLIRRRRGIRAVGWRCKDGHRIPLE